MKNPFFSRVVILASWLAIVPAAHAQLSIFPSVYVDDAIQCGQLTEAAAAARVTPGQQAVLNATMAQHGHRLHHLLWHATRNGWDQLQAPERAAVQSLSEAWGRHAPLCERGSAAGEEFLFMHHQMAAQMNASMLAAGQSCIRGWSRFPAPNDANWPPPAGQADDSSKSAEVGRLIQVWSATFLDSSFLRSHSLAEIGVLVEFSLHNQAHMRWAAIPRQGDDFSPLSASSTPVSLLQITPFDGPEYNWLGNPYSAHVNAAFWKLHGWIDEQLVPAWLHANQFMAISANCRTPLCYTWRSTWDGTSPRAAGPIGGGHEHGGGHGNMGGGMGSGELDGVLRRLAPMGSFRNPGLDQELGGGLVGAPRGGAGPVPGAPPRSSEHPEWNDPVAFVSRFGPCAPRIPSFLRQ